MTEDRDLERLFDELRRADEGSAPAFTHVLERARAKPEASSRPMPRVPLRFALLAALLAAVALATVLLRRPSREIGGRDQPVMLAHWKSQTDWLLRTPGSELLHELPPPPISVPKYPGFERAEKVRGETSRSVR
jgi:hypothetical protein